MYSRLDFQAAYAAVNVAQLLNSSVKLFQAAYAAVNNKLLLRSPHLLEPYATFIDYTILFIVSIKPPILGSYARVKK